MESARTAISRCPHSLHPIRRYTLTALKAAFARHRGRSDAPGAIASNDPEQTLGINSADFV